MRNISTTGQRPPAHRVSASKGLLRAAWRQSTMALALATLAALAACDKSGRHPLAAQASAVAPATSSTTPPAAPPSPPASHPTWKAAVAALYKERSTDPDQDGVHTFTACFTRTDAKKCGALFFARHDGFNHGTVFTAEGTEFGELTADHMLGLRIILKDCGQPTIALGARRFSLNGWLFLQQVAVMADGAVVIDRTAEDSAVTRETLGRGVVESFNVGAEPDDIKALRIIETAKDVSVRLTGKHAFESLTRKEVATFKEDASAVLLAYDQLTAAVAPGSVEACSKP